MMNSLLLAVAMALTLGPGDPQVQSPSDQTQWSTFSQARVAEWSREIVDEQIADLGCTTTPALTDHVAVRNAVGFDRGVVRVVTFDEGLAAGRAGQVFVVGWCA